MTKQLNDFITYQGKNCIIASVRNILRYYSKTLIDESDIFFLGNGLKTEYICENNDILLTLKIFDTIIHFLELYGLSYEIITFKKKNQAIEIIENYINEDIPVITRLSISSSTSSTSLETGYNLNHYSTIIGYDYENYKFFVSDSYIPTTPPSVYSDWYDCDKLLNELSAAGNFMMVIYPQNVTNINMDFIHSHLKNKVKENISKYLIERYDASTGHYLNLFGIERLAKTMPSFLQMYCDTFMEQMINLKLTIKELGLFHSREYLLDVIPFVVTNKDKRLDIVENLDTDIRKWSYICSHIIRTAITKRKDDLQYLSNEILELCKNERIILEKIYLSID